MNIILILYVLEYLHVLYGESKNSSVWKTRLNPSLTGLFAVRQNL